MVGSWVAAWLGGWVVGWVVDWVGGWGDPIGEATNRIGEETLAASHATMAGFASQLWRTPAQPSKNCRSNLGRFSRNYGWTWRSKLCRFSRNDAIIDEATLADSRATMVGQVKRPWPIPAQPCKNWRSNVGRLSRTHSWIGEPSLADSRATM